MNSRDQFYQQRDRRTVEYGVSDVFERPVAVFIGRQAASCRRGQVATLALVNMLARIHRYVQLDIPSTHLIVPSIVPAQRLDEAAHELARAVDPFIKLGHPDGRFAASIGLGDDAPGGLDWYAGATSQIAVVDGSPVSFDLHETPSLGACLSACLAAGSVLAQVLGRPVRSQTVSAWNLREGSDAAPGPEFESPLNVGDVMVVGAGGVGSCFAYWLREFGVKGRWPVVDRDKAELHNTNRCLGLFPRDTDWAGQTPRFKADVAAGLFGGKPHRVWYEDVGHDDGFRPDLVLPLANERNVRHSIACRGEPLLVHATTSTMWEAQLHRHIPDRDDCISCRMPNHESVVQLAPNGIATC